MKALLIAEKGTLMNNIRDAYQAKGFKDTITFKAFWGHTMGLKMPGDYKPEWKRRSMGILPMIPKPFEYAPTAEKVKLYNELKTEVLSGNYDYIINACDAGREGQHIFWSFYDSTGSRLPVKRIWHSDETIDELSRALNNLLDEATTPRLVQMTQASKLRAYFDWLIGMNFSSAFSLVAKNNISAGRVMSPTLRIIVDRETEIRNFTPQKYWQIEGDFGSYIGQYIDEEKKGRFDNTLEAKNFLERLSKEGEVTFVDSKKQTKKAPPLFSLNTLQKEANKVYGYTAAETLAIAQKLYEMKITSYARSESSHLTTGIAKELTKHLTSLLAVPELKERTEEVLKNQSVITKVQNDKMYVDDKKVTDHYAITPTKLKPNLSILSTKERNIYTLIAKRFLSIFLPPLVTNKTKIITTVDKEHDFVSNGSVLISKGFTELYGYNPKDQTLPPLKKGDNVVASEYRLIEKTTTPPPRYNDATIIDAMENAGRFVDDSESKAVLKSSVIGTAATRSSIIEKIVNKNMVERRGKIFIPTDYGFSLIQSLNNHDVTSVELTAEWEGKLRDVEDGKMSANDFYKEMIYYITESTEEIKKMRLSVSGSSTQSRSGSMGESLGKCPECGADVRIGKKYYFCENYKKSCSFILGTKFLDSSISKTEMKKILNGKETKLLKLKGKKGPFTARLKYNTTTKKIEFVFDQNQTGNFQTNKTTLKNSDGDVITEDKFYYILEKKGYKIPKTIWGVTLDSQDIVDLFDGKTLPEKEFTWKSGKKSKAKLFLDQNKKTTAFKF